MKFPILILVAILGVAAIAVTLPAGCAASTTARSGSCCDAHWPRPTYLCSSALTWKTDRSCARWSQNPARPAASNASASAADRLGNLSTAHAMTAAIMTTGDGKTPPGLAAVSITPAARERMGVTLGTVEKRKLAREIRTSARIVPDETRLYHVTVKIDGYVEKLFTATTGEFVKEGEPLLTVYSPMLVSAQQEYLNVLKDNAELAAAARKRLQLWDITDEQIARLKKSGKPERVVTLFAPASGWIMERNISAGHKVLAGEQLLVLGDLSNVWADADIFQSDMPYVKTGMPVELTLSAVPDRVFAGRVSFVAPVLDAETRTVRVRLQVPNPDLLLKPEMYGVARLSYDLGERLAVPETAVLQTGEHIYAFRDAGNGRLVPTEIKIGARSDGWFELLRGLSAGDKVVTSANFLVDSESSMKAAIEAVAGK
ncbi:MAG: efflux RND transporter periplasmic adaptor subunit [Kiritimatiellaeota bacterium]|nr:efflux RND transporter periplasmic adaptor subunit [Kiritimatiellota bacterium]